MKRITTTSQAKRIVSTSLAVAILLTPNLVMSQSVPELYLASKVARKLTQDDRVRQATLALTYAATVPADGYHLPPAPVLSGSPIVGGGMVPSTLGAPVDDGFGGKLGYCAWDNGTTTNTTGYLVGQASMSAVSLAVVSPGQDGLIQTACADIAAGTFPRGDDFVQLVRAGQLLTGGSTSRVIGETVTTKTALDSLPPETPIGQVRYVSDEGRFYAKSASGWERTSVGPFERSATNSLAWSTTMDSSLKLGHDMAADASAVRLSVKKLSSAPNIALLPIDASTTAANTAMVFKGHEAGAYSMLESQTNSNPAADNFFRMLHRGGKLIMEARPSESSPSSTASSLIQIDPVGADANGAAIKLSVANANATNTSVLTLSENGGLALVTTGAAANKITANQFVGALTGNATSATKLATARLINGVAFDGTSNITIEASDPTKLPLTGGALTGALSTNSTISALGAITGSNGATFTTPGSGHTSRIDSSYRNASLEVFNDASPTDISYVRMSRLSSTLGRGTASGLNDAMVNATISSVTASAKSAGTTMATLTLDQVYSQISHKNILNLTTDAHKIRLAPAGITITTPALHLGAVPDPSAPPTLAAGRTVAVYGGMQVAGDLLLSDAGAVGRALNLTNAVGSGSIGVSAAGALTLSSAGNLPIQFVSTGGANFNGPVTASNFVGNATSASKLATARTINGVAFDGTSDITITANDPTKLALTGGTIAGNLAVNGLLSSTGGINASYASGSILQQIGLDGASARMLASNSSTGKAAGLTITPQAALLSGGTTASPNAASISAGSFGAQIEATQNGSTTAFITAASSGIDLFGTAVSIATAGEPVAIWAGLDVLEGIQAGGDLKLTNMASSSARQVLFANSMGSGSVGVNAIGRMEMTAGGTAAMTVHPNQVSFWAGVDGANNSSVGEFTSDSFALRSYGDMGQVLNEIYAAPDVLNIMGQRIVLASGTDAPLYVMGAGGMEVGGPLTAATVTTTSDARLKSNINSLGGTDLVSRFMATRPVSYVLNSSGRLDNGWLAQELMAQFPEMVFQNSKTGMYSVNYSSMIPVVATVVQKHERDIESLRATKLDSITDTWIRSTDGGGRLYFETGGKTVLKGVGPTAVEIRNGDDTPVAAFMSNGDLAIKGALNFIGGASLAGSGTPEEIAVRSHSASRAAIRMEVAGSAGSLAPRILGMLFGDSSGVGLADGNGKALLTAKSLEDGNALITLAGDLRVGTGSNATISLGDAARLVAGADGWVNVESRNGLRIGQPGMEAGIVLGTDGTARARRFVPTEVVESYSACTGQHAAIARDANGQVMVCQ